MTFAKNAAELLSDPEAEQAPADKGRWRKYLAAGAGLAGLAGAGYYAYKNRDALGAKIDALAGTVPNKGLIERTTGVSGGMAGAGAGMGLGYAATRHFGPGSSVAGLVNATNNAAQTSPIGRQLGKLKELLSMSNPEDKSATKAEASNVGSAFQPSMTPGSGDKTMLDVHNIGAKAQGRPTLNQFTNPEDRDPLDPRRLYDRFWKSKRELGSTVHGLGQIAQKPEAHPGVTEGVKRLWGSELGEPARLKTELTNLSRQSGSTLGGGVRAGLHGLGGSVLGHLIDQNTQKPVP